MAINWIEDGSLFSSSPNWYRRVGYEEIGRDASTVTIRVHLHLKLKGNGSSTFYGYPAYWSVNDGGAMQIKTSSRWYGGQDYRAFSTDIRVGANAGGGTGSFKIHMWSTSGGNAGFTQNFSFNYSKWNTKPYWIGGNKITLRENNAGGRVISSEAWGTENAYKFAENIGAIYVDWGGQARDNENNPLTYELWMQSNEGGWSVIYSGNNTNFTHYIGEGAGTQGYSYDYYVRVRDSYGEWADGECNATQVQKNQLSQAMLNHSGSVNFDTTTINLSRTNASNTNGNGAFTYKLYSNDITVYNGDKVSGNSIPVAIYKSGNVPNTPYIKWEDLKRFLAGNNYNRNLRFILTTTNAYGSTSSDYEDIWCDIRKSPTGFSFNTVSGVTVVNGKSYFIPSEEAFTMTWGVSTDPLGTQVTYDLYYAYDNVSWNLLASNLTKNTFTGKLPNVGKLTILTFRVVAKTSYGTTTATEGGRTELHYVGTPSVSMKLTRNQSNYVIDGTVTANSSIPNLSLSQVRYRDNDSARFDEAQINGLTFKISRNLGETEAQELVVYVLDRANSDLGRQPTEQKISISRYMPMLSIREKGVGVNAIPDGSAKLIVNGGLKVDGKGLDTIRYFGKRLITIGGDKNTYYPVLLRSWGGYATNRISISRGYSWQAPDTWNTPTHKGGLTFSFKWAGDGTWGGNSREYTVEEFSETYTTMVAGMTNTTGGFVVWLRGGGAQYQIENDFGLQMGVEVHLNGYTAPDKATYAPRANTNNVPNEIHKFYCVRSNHLYDEGRRVLTEGSFGGRLKLDNNALFYDGDFKAGRVTGGSVSMYGNDFTMNNKRALVGWAGQNDPLIINYNKDFRGGTRIVGDTEICESANPLNLKGNGNNHVYMGFYPRADGSIRGAWVGYGSNGTNDFNINNDIGNVYLNGHDRVVANNLHANGWIQSPQLWVTDNGGLYSGHNSQYIVKDHGNGNVTLSAAGGQLYLGYKNTSSIKVEQEYWDVGASSGCMLRISAPWAGTAGGEPAIFNSKGKGWGFLGNSDWAWYRVYGNGGTVSQRNTKYDIHKFDNVLLYDYVKQLNTYAYRTITDEKDENNEIINTLKRSDMQLGCMIEEMPTEVVFYDGEGGNGGAVDNYAYTTMILGATKILQDKVEKLEENEEVLKEEMESLKIENKDLKNRLNEIERILKSHGIN